MSYTVGVNNDGIILKVGEDGGMITTLTMTEGAVIQMIKLLAATLETATVTIDVKKEKDEDSD